MAVEVVGRNVLANILRRVIVGGDVEHGDGVLWVVCRLVLVVQRHIHPFVLRQRLAGIEDGIFAAHTGLQLAAVFG